MTENKVEHKHNDEHDCEDGCGCGEDIKTMQLVLNDGSEVEWEVLKKFAVNENEYIALAPEEGKDVFMYKFNEDEDGVELHTIEDDEEFQEVGEVLNRILDLEAADHEHN